MPLTKQTKGWLRQRRTTIFHRFPPGVALRRNLARTDVHEIDAEGHELHVPEGASALIAEERHRLGAPHDVFDFSASRDEAGFLIATGQARQVAEFRNEMQNPSLRTANAPRKELQYINNFIFIPQERRPVGMQAALDKQVFQR